MIRKELLIRENRGRRERGKYAEALSIILNRTISDSDFVDLTASDEVCKSFFDTYKMKSNESKKVYPKDHVEDLKRELISNEVNFRDIELYLISKQTNYCGCVKISFSEIIDCFSELIELDKDSLFLCSKDSDYGLGIDSYEEYDGGFIGYYYELVIWKSE